MKKSKWFYFKKIKGHKEYPLCWGGKALEFDTKEDAEYFLSNPQIKQEIEIGIGNPTELKQCILYYDNGNFNASGYKIEYDYNKRQNYMINYNTKDIIFSLN